MHAPHSTRNRWRFWSPSAPPLPPPPLPLVLRHLPAPRSSRNMRLPAGSTRLLACPPPKSESRAPPRTHPHMTTRYRPLAPRLHAPNQHHRREIPPQDHDTCSRHAPQCHAARPAPPPLPTPYYPRKPTSAVGWRMAVQWQWCGALAGCMAGALEPRLNSRRVRDAVGCHPESAPHLHANTVAAGRRSKVGASGSDARAAPTAARKLRRRSGRRRRGVVARRRHTHVSAL